MRKFSDSIHGSVQMIGIVIAALVAIAVGVLVWYKLQTALYSAASGPGTGPHVGVNASFLAVNTTANTIWTLFPIVCIVMIAGIILAIVMGFGRSQA